MLKNKLKLYFLTGLSLAWLAIPFAPVYGQSLMDDIQNQNQVFAGEKGADLKNTDPRLVVARAINILLGILGTLLTAWIVYGGFLILTSAGDTEKMDQGKSVIKNGVIGLILILSAYAIANFVSKAWVEKIAELPVLGQEFRMG